MALYDKHTPRAQLETRLRRLRFMIDRGVANWRERDEARDIERAIAEQDFDAQEASRSPKEAGAK